MKFRPDIEGLRAVAVTLVLLAHLEVSGFKGGFVGVDIFFVISGYLITGLITAEFAKKEALEPKSGWVSLRAFYFRRVKRIIPVSFLVLTVTTIASFILLNSIRAKEVLNDSIWAALFGANIHFIRIATDYFQQGAATSPVQHYWSLAVEEQFYLVIPALFILAVNIIRLRIIPTRASWKFRIRFLFSLIVLLSFIWSIVATSSSPASAYFSSLTRAWELGVGALLAVGTFERPSRIKSRYLLLFALAGIALFAFSTLAFSASTNFPGYAALAPVVGAALIIFAGSNSENIVSKILSTKVFTSIGRISYSLYLWHWPMIVLLNATHPHLLKTSQGKAALILVALLFSYLSFKFVEQPIRQIAIPRRWREERATLSGFLSSLNSKGFKISVSALLAIALFVFGLSFATSRSTQKVSTPTPTPAVTASATPSPSPATLEPYTKLLSRWSQKILDSTFIDTVKGITPTFDVTQSYDTWRNPDCTHQASIFGVSEIKNLAICRQGTGTKIALFIGNSHARMWQRAVTQPFVKSGWTIYSFFMPWCMIPNLNGIDHKFDKVYDCDLYHNDLKILLAKMKPSVVVVSERLFPTMSFKAAGQIYPENTSESKFWSLYQDELTTIRKTVPTVIVLGVTPELPKPISECVDAQSNLDLMCQANGAKISATVTSQSNAVKAAGAQFIDSRDWLCYKQVACPAIIDNTMVYKDLDHTSYPIESKLSLLFGAYLKQNAIL